MAPGQQIDEITVLRSRLAEVETELEGLKKLGNNVRQRFRDLLDATPLMTWMSGPDAMCTFFNKAWLEFRGRTMDEETGNGWTEGVHPDDRDLCLETYLAAYTARQPFRVQYRMRRANGEFAWVEDSGLPRLEDGTFAGFMGTAVDISDRRRRMFTPDETSVRLVFALTEREQQTLGEDDLGSEEFVLSPGETRTVTRELRKGVQLIGAVVLFRDIDHAQWRAVAAVGVSGPTRLILRTSRLGVRLAPS